MNKQKENITQRMDNQAIGLLPLLILMFLDHFCRYVISFEIAAFFCAVSIVVFWGLFRDRIYQFMLLPVVVTLVLYSIFLIIRLDPVLSVYTPLITEWLLVLVLAVFGIFRRIALSHVRNSSCSALKRTRLQAALEEFFYEAHILQNLYTVHLFIVLFYMILADENQHSVTERFLCRDASWIIGSLLILYEQIRIWMIKRNLKREKWLPVLNEKGLVIGRIAYSVSLESKSKSKHCHPVVRVAVVYNGMLYLTRRDEVSPVSPGALDYPFLGYVLYSQTVDQMISDMLGDRPVSKKSLIPRFLIRYPFENEQISSLVSLYVITLRTEEEYVRNVKPITGKLWTRKQIEQNLGKGVFSEYFEQEYPYLRNTVLLAGEYDTSSRRSGSHSNGNDSHPDGNDSSAIN